jgi:hypothetical protein
MRGLLPIDVIDAHLDPQTLYRVNRACASSTATPPH